MEFCRLALFFKKKIVIQIHIVKVGVYPPLKHMIYIHIAVSLHDVYHFMAPLKAWEMTLV